MASHQLIDSYLGELGAKLPAGTMEELADGLYETWRHHLDRGMNPDAAAQTAIIDFGTAQQVNDAFVAAAPGRRTARNLLATGPIAAIAWGTSLITAKAWTWHIPLTAALGFAVMLLGVVACLALAATSRHVYRRTRLGNLGAAGLLILDAAAITAIVLAAPILVWPMAVAVLASAARIGLTIRSLPKSRLYRAT